MNISKLQPDLIDDPVSETMAMLRSQPFPIMVVIVLVVLQRAEDELGLSPATRLIFLTLLQRMMAKATHRIA